MDRTPTIFLIRTFLGLTLLLAGVSLPAQQDKILFQNYGVNEGLPEASARCMLQDRQGYIWAGTQRGLVRSVVFIQLCLDNRSNFIFD